MKFHTEKFELKVDSFISKIIPYTLTNPGQKSGFDDLSF